MNLVLIGVRGSGKSTAGVQLARRIDLSFVDLDREIEKLSGSSLAELICGAGGEPEFRRLESRALARLAGCEGSVLATGGGVVQSRANRESLKRLGPVIWLAVSPEEAVRRTAGERRPPLTDLPPLEEARQVAEHRAPLYHDLADAVVETDGKSLEEVCDELEQLWYDLSRHHLR